MSFCRNKQQDRERTRKKISNCTHANRTHGKNWLGHCKHKKCGQIDEMLIGGASIEEMANKLSSTKGYIRRRLYHLQNEHGLTIINHGAKCRFGDDLR
jgi:hypothetical protein